MGQKTGKNRERNQSNIHASKQSIRKRGKVNNNGSKMRHVGEHHFVSHPSQKYIFSYLLLDIRKIISLLYKMRNSQMFMGQKTGKTENKNNEIFTHQNKNYKKKKKSEQQRFKTETC